MKTQRLLTILICFTLAVSAACFGYYFAAQTDPVAQPPAATTTAAPLPTTTLPVTTAPQTTAPQTTPPVTQPTTLPAETTAPTEPLPTTAATQPPTEAPTEPATQPPTSPPTTAATQPATQPEPLPPAPVDVQITAKNAFVYDLAAENFLYFYGDPDAPIEPASITKLFSAYVGLQYLSPETELTVGEEVNWIDPGSSRAYIYKGYRLTVEQCIQGMIIPSGNDAAYVLAVSAGRVIAGDANISAKAAYNAFVDEMNRQAQALGLTGTHFVNPDGMNEKDHYTSLRDLLTIAKIAMETPLIRQAAQVQQMKAVFAGGQYAYWTNSNQMLDKNYPDFYCSDAIGLKTGSTSTAGKCLLAAFEHDGRILLVCVMGCPTNADRYADALALYQACK